MQAAMGDMEAREEEEEEEELPMTIWEATEDPDSPAEAAELGMGAERLAAMAETALEAPRLSMRTATAEMTVDQRLGMKWRVEEEEILM
jgi:hypothetical protein